VATGAAAFLPRHSATSHQTNFAIMASRSERSSRARSRRSSTAGPSAPTACWSG